MISDRIERMIPKIRIMTGIAAIVAMMAMSGCGKGKERNIATPDSDTLTIVTDLVGDTLPVFYLTAEGIGNVKIGDELSELPDMVTGLYTSRGEGMNVEARAVQFSNNTGVVFTALDFMEGKIDMIYLDNGYVKVAAPDGDFGMGDSFLNVLSLPGVKAEWENHDAGGEWYWNWEGLWFGVDPQHIPEKLQKKLYDSENEPTESDFDIDTRIGYVGTGLAF